MRNTIPVNFGWKFSPSPEAGWTTAGFDDSTWQDVDIPHANVLLPRHYMQDDIACTTCCYRKVLDIGNDVQGKRVLLHFEAVSSTATVWIDGTKVSVHEGAYLPFDIELTNLVKPGIPCVVAVAVDSSEDPRVPPFGGVMDYLAYGGIYRPVSLQILDAISISDACVRTTFDGKQWTVSAQATICGEPDGQLQCSMSLCLDGKLLEHTRVDVVARQLSASVVPTEPALWSVEHPVLHDVTLSLLHDDVAVDTLVIRIGIRTVAMTGNGFLLNGKPLKLCGLNRHQSYPYVGYAVPDTMQADDARLLKHTLGCNVVRTSHYPQSPAFLDACDQLGLLVLEEIPGWQHVSSDAHWRDLTVDNVRQMVVRDRNHPCICAWGVRINESPDDHELYERTNAEAHAWDDTRPTCGIRNLAKSELLEDIYTYNDFSHDGTNRALQAPHAVTGRRNTPYLVTEHTGHMFPTRRNDSEAHRTEHAMRHARVLDAMYGTQGIGGAIGWCMSDYNTHEDFGSGDQVCYHGVCDMFRIPKLAAYAYASQTDGQVVLAVSSTMDIGEYPASNIPPVVVFTNCDAVRLLHGDDLVGEFLPAAGKFPHLSHPPVIIDDFIGHRIDSEQLVRPADRKILHKVLLAAQVHGFNLPLWPKLLAAYLMVRNKISVDDIVSLYCKYVGGWGTQRAPWTFQGVLDGQVVAQQLVGGTVSPALQVAVDRQTLVMGDTYDMVLLKVTAVMPGSSSPLAYANEGMEVSCAGAVAIVGPTLTQLDGGTCGILVRSIGLKGSGSVSIRCAFGDISVPFMVE